MSKFLLYEEMDVIEILRDKCTEAGGRYELATSIGMDEKALDDIIQGRQAPNDKVLEFLGLKRIIRYVPVEFPRD